MLQAISCYLVGIKTAPFQITSSLWADINLDGTNPEDQDTPLDYSFVESLQEY